MRMKNKKWSIPYLNDHPEVVVSNEEYDQDKLQNFLNNSPLFLEIGTGKGDFICNMAKKNPNSFFLGIEKSTTCLAITAKKVVNAELKNVLLISDDIMNIFANIKKHTIDIIFLNFSDPWPKKRHTKRRLTYETFLNNYREILKENGKIIMKTDNLGLFDFSIDSLKSSNFEIEYINYDYNGLDEFDTMTEYEAYFRNEGTTIKKLIAKVGKENGTK